MLHCHVMHPNDFHIHLELKCELKILKDRIGSCRTDLKLSNIILSLKALERGVKMVNHVVLNKQACKCFMGHIHSP